MTYDLDMQYLEHIQTCFCKTDLKILKFEGGRENFGQNQDPIIGQNPDPNIVLDPEEEKVHDYNGTCSEARN